MDQLKDNSYQAHIDYLYERTNMSNEIWITSGNVYAGITYYGSDTLANSDSSLIRGWLNYLEDNSGRINTKILIGIPFYKSCKPVGIKDYCDHCARGYAKLILKLANHAIFFNNLEWYMKDHVYLKAICFEHAGEADAYESDLGKRNWSNVITTRNLTDMDENQFSFLDDGIEVPKQVSANFKDATKIDDEGIGNLLEKVGINRSTIEGLLND